MGGAGYGTSDNRSSTTGSHYPITIADPGVGGMWDYRGPPPCVSLGTLGTLPSSKERESTTDGSLHVANGENGEGGSGQGGGLTFQHRDGLANTGGGSPQLRSNFSR